MPGATAPLRSRRNNGAAFELLFAVNFIQNWMRILDDLLQEWLPVFSGNKSVLKIITCRLILRRIYRVPKLDDLLQE